MKTNIALLLIVLFAFFLRIYQISSNPPSLNWDEVSHGYNAYSIAKTGKDEWGEHLPTIFKAYGDYKLPVYIYVTAASTKIFGVNEFSVRFPSVLAGTFSVLFTFFLAEKLLNSKKTALIAGFLVAIEPWSLFLSRGAFEANLALFLFISGFYLFLEGLTRKNWRILVGTVLLGLTVWTYNSYRIFTPLLIIAAATIYKDELLEMLKAKKILSSGSVILLIIFILPMFFQLLSPAGQARFSWVSIIDQGAIEKIISLRRSSNFSPLLTRFIYNRPTYFFVNFIKNYTSHFSPSFLFLKGGSHYQFNIPDFGLLYLINLPLIILGLYSLMTKKTKNSKLILLWILLSPIPSSLTRQAPHTLRNITTLPIPMILTALGLKYSLNKHKPSRLRISPIPIYILILLGFLTSYLSVYFVSYKHKYSQAWQFGYKEVAKIIEEKYDNYDKILITKKYGEPHEFILFYNAASSSAQWAQPEKFQNDPNLIRFRQTNWFWVDRFDKFYFLNDWDIKDLKLESGGEVDCHKLKCLLISTPNNHPNSWELTDSIEFLDKKTAFEIYEN